MSTMRTDALARTGRSSALTFSDLHSTKANTSSSSVNQAPLGDYSSGQRARQTAAVDPSASVMTATRATHLVLLQLCACNEGGVRCRIRDEEGGRRFVAHAFRHLDEGPPVGGQALAESALRRAKDARLAWHERAAFRNGRRRADKSGELRPAMASATELSGM